jgi:Trypsin-like peptidase domain/N-acetylmuramoyl-L-alanine amidase
LYEQDSLGKNLKIVEYKLDPEQFFQKNLDPELDYALVKLKALTETEKEGYNLVFHEAGDNFGWLSMLEEHRIIAPPYNLPNRKKFQSKKVESNPDQYNEFGIYYDVLGEPVIIIQHPRGRHKEIVIFNNRVQKIYKDFLQYETATDFGSSGGPAFNRKWQLISLHHATLVDINNEQHIGHLGIRINRIISDLKQAIDKSSGEEPKLIQDFIKNFVVLKNQKFQRGKIFLVPNYLDIYTGKEPREWVERICEYIISTLKENDKHGFKIIKIPDNLGSMKKVIEHIENDYGGYKVGDIALQIYISERNPENERGTTIFYVANKDERRLHAELLLQSLANAFPTDKLPSQGAKSDNTTKMGKIDFCSDLRMPSLSMRLGFYKNQKDMDIIKDNTEKIAKVIAQGLIDWDDTLSPIPDLSEFD